MEDVDAVPDELVGRDLERVFARLHKPALHAVGDVRELDATVANRGAAVLGENERMLANLVSHRNGLALQKPHVPVYIANHLDARGLLAILVDQIPY